MFKKIIFLCFMIAVFVFTVSAKDFFVWGEDNTDVSSVLNMTEEEIKKYCEENKVTYLAVNSDNTKLIKRVETSDEFSKRIVDLSVLSDENIKTLSYELSRISDANGSIVAIDGFKLLKYELKQADDNYYLTTYITVKDSKRITLSFYTNVGIEQDYIEAVVNEQFKAEIDYKPFVIAGIVLFALIGVVFAVLIVKDWRNKDA